MRTVAIAIAVAALASAAVCPGACQAKATPHPRVHTKVAAAPAANPITSDQADAVVDLTKTGLSIQADVNNTIASVSDEQVSQRRHNESDSVLYIECFQVLYGITAELTGNLKELMVATVTAHLAKDPADLNASLRFTRMALDDVGASVGVVQRVVDSPQSPACRSSQLYRDQVSKLQAFTHDVTGVTDDLAGATIPQSDGDAGKSGG
jgi:hypothetical protein